MPDFTEQILTAVGRKSYTPLKPKALARKLGVPQKQYGDFRGSLRELIRQGRLHIGKNQTVRLAGQLGTVTGTFRRTGSGLGFVRPHLVDGQAGAEIAIRADDALDAVTGDQVLVQLRHKGRGEVGPRGVILQVLERAARQFVGTYFEREGQGYVRVDGTVFSHSIYVGDPGARGVRPDDKVVIEMLRFPSQEDPRGEAVISEVLGPRGQPGVDTLSIIRELGLPDAFPQDVLEEARAAADSFNEKDLDGRQDFTGATVITIDPVDARDFDDGVSLIQDRHSRHWLLSVHIADVAHFVPPGSALDREAPARHQCIPAAAGAAHVPGGHQQWAGQPAAGASALRQERPHRLHPHGSEDSGHLCRGGHPRPQTLHLRGGERGVGTGRRPRRPASDDGRRG